MGGEVIKLHSNWVEKFLNYTRNGWRSYKTTGDVQAFSKSHVRSGIFNLVSDAGTYVVFRVMYDQAYST